jgi:flagellar hook assembly protein FlgD
VQWDGRDQRGDDAPAGVYFVRIRSGQEEKAVKIVLVR